MADPSMAGDEYWIVYGGHNPSGRTGETFYSEAPAVERYEEVAKDSWSDMPRLVHCKVIRRKNVGGK